MYAYKQELQKNAQREKVTIILLSNAIIVFQDFCSKRRQMEN
jgi:hypothetical protein